MLGFEVEYNNSIVSVPINNYCLTVTIEADDNVNRLKFSGSDTKHNSILWMDSILETDDVISIKIKNIDNPSSPIDIKSYESAAELNPAQEKEQYERNLKTLNILEEILKSKGLI